MYVLYKVVYNINYLLIYVYVEKGLFNYDVRIMIKVKRLRLKNVVKRYMYIPQDCFISGPVHICYGLHSIYVLQYVYVVSCS